VCPEVDAVVGVNSALTTIAGEKQREWEAWEAATLEAIAFGYGDGEGVGESEREEGHWACSLLESAYQVNLETPFASLRNCAPAFVFSMCTYGEHR
jgi:hypothetical protein